MSRITKKGCNGGYRSQQWLSVWMNMHLLCMKRQICYSWVCPVQTSPPDVRYEQTSRSVRHDRYPWPPTPSRSMALVVAGHTSPHTHFDSKCPLKSQLSMSKLFMQVAMICYPWQVCGITHLKESNLQVLGLSEYLSCRSRPPIEQ